MKLPLIFQPLCNFRAIKVAGIAAILTAIIYGLFSVIVAAGAIGFRVLPPAELLSFAAVKAFLSFTAADWIVFALFPVAAGLLFANYDYWRCKSQMGQVGLFAGLIAATCPACILPVLGLTAFTTLAFRISWVIKLAALAFIVFATYLIARKQQKCRMT